MIEESLHKTREEAKQAALADMVTDPDFEGAVLTICRGDETCPHRGEEPTPKQQDRCQSCERITVSAPGNT